MRRTTKRWIMALLAAVLMAVLAVSASAEDHGGIIDSGICGSGLTKTWRMTETYVSWSAQPSDISADELTWTLYEDGLLEINGRGEMTDYSYSYVDSNDPWSRITSAPWGKYADKLKSLKMSKDLVSIGAYAFYECSGLTGSLTIPENVIVIGQSAFDGCSGFTGDLKLPDGLIYIFDSAFQNCQSLTGQLVIPDRVEGIGGGVFNLCNFSTATIPANVIMGRTPFSNMKELTEVRINGKSDRYSTYDGVLYSKDYSKLLFCPAGKTGTISIHPSTLIIGDGAFERCEKLTGSLTIPEGVTQIEQFSFSSCSGFTGNLIIPESVTEIGQYAFERCSGFTGNLIIPAGVNLIGQGAFYRCNGITVAYFMGDAPKAWKYSYDWHGFSGCAEGFAIYYLNGKSGWTTPEWNGFPCYPLDELPEELLEATGISLNKTEITVTIGSTYKLVAEIIPSYASNKTVTWETDDPTVATVKDGVVTGVGIGTATITVTTNDGGFTATCEVTVTDVIRGDMNGDNEIDSNDAIYLLRHTMNQDRYLINQSGDVNGDGEVDSNDAIYLLRHTMNKDRYPLK